MTIPTTTRSNPNKHGINGVLVQIVLMFLCASSLNAAGQTSFPVLMELMDARTLALGGAVVSDNAQLGSAQINPAATSGSGRLVKAAYANHMLDLWSGNLAYSHPLNDRIEVGGFLNNFDYGEFNTTAVGQGLTGASFTSSEYVLGGFCSFAHSDRFRYGGTLKYVWGNLDGNSASGIAADAGLVYDPDWQRIILGVALRNFGRQLSSYGDKDDPLPTELILGGSKQLQHLPLEVNANVALSGHGDGDLNLNILSGEPNEPNVAYSVSGEFTVQPQSAERPIFLRIGYRSRGEELRVGNSKDIVGGMSFGFGIPFKRMQIDYAYASLGALGDIHRFGITGFLD